MTRCWFCLHVRRATTHVNGKPACSSCARELVAKPIDLVIAPGPKRTPLAIHF